MTAIEFQVQKVQPPGTGVVEKGEFWWTTSREWYAGRVKGDGDRERGLVVEHDAGSS